MAKTYLNQVKLHIRENLTYYAVSAALLAFGAILAALCACNMTELTQKELALYFDDFFKSFAESGVDAGEILLSSLVENAILFGCLLLFSGSLVGLPLIALLALYRGYAFGFTVTLIFRFYGLRAILFVLVSVLPHLLITLPCLLMVLSFSIRFATQVIKERVGMKESLIRYFLSLCILFFIMLAGNLMEAYIEPIMLKLAIQFFI